MTLLQDLKSETPKIYKWICGALVSISAAAGSVALAYPSLPSQFQILPDSILKIIAGLSLLGAVMAKKQNVK